MAQPFTTQSPVSVNYSYSDIASGTGMQKYYIINTQSSVGSNPILISFLEEGSDQSLTVGGTTDIDLTPFNLTQKVKGIGYISFYNTRVSANVSVKFQLKKYDGTTETNLTSVIESRTITAGVGQTALLALPITETLFNKGDILRLSIEAIGTGSTISADPTSTYPSILYIPFDLRL